MDSSYFKPRANRMVSDMQMKQVNGLDVIDHQSSMTIADLVNEAYEAMTYAYVPYSKFQVGAALLSDSGELFTGCNVECASYGGTNCAERTALFKAISVGVKSFNAIAIVSSSKEATFPCGICRQVLSEFGKDMRVFLAHGTETYYEFVLSELIPFCFTGEDIK